MGIVLRKCTVVLLCIVSIFSDDSNAHYKRLSQFNYNAASVLINTQIKKQGKPIGFILLGREAGGLDRGMWDDFGGSRESSDLNSLVTAARELYEEAIISQTIGWALTHTKEYISLKKTNTSHILALSGINNTNHVLYITQFPFELVKKLCRRFFIAREYAQSSEYKEKDGLALVRWHDLMGAIKQKKNIVPALVYNKKTKTFSRIKKTITLRPLLCAKLKNFAAGSRFMQGIDRRVRFYTY